MKPSASAGAPPSADEPVLFDLVEEMAARLQSDDAAAVEAWTAAQGVYAERLRRLLPTVRVMAELGSADGQAPPGPEDGPVAGLLGDYRIVREVGRGGMGVVYEAEQISLGRRVALKVLPFAATMDARHLQRFKNEARAAASLHHEHVVPVHGVGCERGVHFYAMQFIDGTTLAQAIRGLRDAGDGPAASPDAGPNSDATTAPAAAPPTAESRALGKAHFRRAAELIAQAADALEYAHSVGVVHRDVKPGNLMVDAAGKLWVTDFGLAKLDAAAGVTVSGDLLGTLRYMSPEQALAKHGLVDHRTDVYSLGATLYELLTLQPAVDGPDREEILRRIAFEEPAPPRKLARSIPAELETVTLKALAKDPADRYPAAAEMAEDLRRWLAGKPVQARRAGPWERAAKWVRRRPALAGLLAVSAVAVLGLVAGLAWHNAQLRDAAERERNQALEANLQKEEAQKQRAFARRAADKMYTQVAAKWLASEPGSEKLQREFLEEALRFYQELAREPDADPSVQKELANAYRRMGDIHLKLGRPAEAEQALGKAMALAEQLAAQHPDQADYQEDLASIYYQVGNLHKDTSRPQAGEEYFRRSLAIDRKLAALVPSVPRHRQQIGMALINLGAVLLNTGRHREAEEAWREARSVLEKVTAESPETAEYHFTLGGALNNLAILVAQQGKLGDARDLLEDAIRHQKTALRINPRNKRALTFLDSHYSCLSEVLRRLGEPAKALTAMRESIAVAERLVAEFPETASHRSSLAQGQVALGQFYLNTGHPGEAEASFRSALATLEKAAADFPRVAVNKGMLAEIHNYLGTVACDFQRKYPEAEAEFREAIRLRPGSFDGHHNLGNALSRQKRYAEAEAAYREALRRKPADAEAHERLGLALAAQSRYAEAEAAYREAIRIKPDSHGGHFNLGTLLADHLGQPKQAEAEFREALRLKPDYPGAHLNLGIVLVRQGRLREAEAEFREAVRLRPNHLQSQLNLGHALYDQGLYQAALAAYREALRLKPDDADVRYSAACAAARAGCGQGKDCPPTEDPERARLRRQALDWLRADLAHWEKQLHGSAAAERQAARGHLQHWQRDPELAEVRDATGLKDLPAAEQQAWQKLWAEVAALLDTPGTPAPDKEVSPQKR
jgi:tetratricopeptide (TPR) repeat protein